MSIINRGGSSDPPLSFYEDIVKTIFGPYTNGMVRVNGKLITFKDSCAQVDDATAAFLLTRSGYQLHPSNKCLNANSILIIRNQGLGDVLFCTVVPKFLKKINPKCLITFGTFPRNFRAVENNPFIDKVIDCNAALDRDYDYSCNLNNYFESGEMTRFANILHRVNMLRRMFESLPEIKYWDNNIYYATTKEEQEYAKEILKPYRGKKIISFFPQASEITRRYPDCNGLVRFLADKGYVVVVMSPGGERFVLHNNILNLAGQTTVAQIGGIIEASHLVISPDSGPLHLAGALDKKIISFFNSFLPATRTMYYKNCFAFSAEKTCPMKRYPCGYGKCPASCLKAITFKMIYEKVVEKIGY